ncbi:ribonuclease H-like domain-containing protein [Tanacetum coccineum]
MLGAIGKLLLRPRQVVIGDPKDTTRTKSPNTIGDPQKALKNKEFVDSGCSKHMTENKAYLVEYQDYNGGLDTFGGSKGQITGKGKIITRKLDFKDGYFVKELKQFNLFSVSQMCDKKNKVLFTDSECFVLSPYFKLPDENQVLLRFPRQNNTYSFNLENIVPTGGLVCLIAKAIVDESNKWHRRFSWVFFLRTKDETSGILKDFIRQIKNQLNQKVKTIRCDNGTEFKNRDIIEFCGSKGIKREYSNARTLQQNGVAERKNRTLIKAARTMLADSFLPNTFWAEAVSTACYVLNRVLVTKPQNKTPYELITGKIPIISYIRPFGCHVTILNTIDHLGKFEEKSDEGFLVGSENQANKHAGPQEANQNASMKYIIDAKDSEKDKMNLAPRYLLKRQEKDANDEAEKSQKGLHKKTENLLINRDFTNLESIVNVSPIPTSRIHSIHPSTLILRDPQLAVQTRSKVTKSSRAHAFNKKVERECCLRKKQGIEAFDLFSLALTWVHSVSNMDIERLQSGDECFYGFHKLPEPVQVYVDDIIFGSTKKSWCDEFEALMKSRFQMSSMGELTFFLGLQILDTQLEDQKPLVKDEEASLDSDYARANLDRKSTTGRLSISWQMELLLAASCCG